MSLSNPASTFTHVRLGAKAKTNEGDNMVMHQDINTAKNIDYGIWTQDTSIFLQGFQVFCACSPVTRMHVVVDVWIQPTMRLCKESENFKGIIHKNGVNLRGSIYLCSVSIISATTRSCVQDI